MNEATDLAQTRAALHAVAEHLLAAGQWRAAGTIRLRPVAGGFATVAGPRTMAVIGGQLVVTDEGSSRETPLTTLAEAARFAGVEPGMPASVYEPATPFDPEAALPVDPVAARHLADWFALADAALRRFAGELGADQVPVLWPEHFDLGITAEAVNYGASPGDAVIDEPYLYVGPHVGRPVEDDFWNAPFGAALVRDRVPAVDAAVAFYRAGRSRLRDGSVR